MQRVEERVPTDEALRSIRTYADGVGPNTRLVNPQNADGLLLPPNDLVRRAHATGLLVHAGRPVRWPHRPHRALDRHDRCRRTGPEGPFPTETAVRSVKRKR